MPSTNVYENQSHIDTKPIYTLSGIYFDILSDAYCGHASAHACITLFHAGPAHRKCLAADYMVVLMMRSVHACVTLLHSSPAQREHLAMGTVHACVTLLRSNPIRGHTSMLMQTACFAQTALATCRLTKRCPKDKFGVSRQATFRPRRRTFRPLHQHTP